MGDDECAMLCGNPKDHDHHVSGRGHDHEQLDDEFLFPVCTSDHQLIHDDLRSEGIDNPLLADTVPEIVERCLRRRAVIVARLHERLEWPWLALAADALARMADMLYDHVEELDYRFPGWRQE
jgi:hypothetical protein